MSKQLLHPQEIEVYYIIPTIRRYFAIELAKTMPQNKVAKILGISSSTISQYKSTKRGHKIILPEIVIQRIKLLAPSIKDTYAYIQETQNLLKLCRDNNILCDIHHLISELPLQCKQGGCQ
jgi:predicted transcriptional regulator